MEIIRNIATALMLSYLLIYVAYGLVIRPYLIKKDKEEFERKNAEIKKQIDKELLEEAKRKNLQHI